jgi:hypothetical protein
MSDPIDDALALAQRVPGCQAVPAADEDRERLAALEHEQWVKWAQSVMDSEPISEARRERWERFMVPYADLDEPTKDYDREWADRALVILRGRCLPPSTGDAESEEQRRIEQAYIDGSVEGSPIDHDGDLISGEVTRYGAVPAADDEHAEWYRQGWEAGNKAARHVPAADDRLREAAQRVVAAKPVRWNDRPADSFIEAVGVLRTTLDAARATVPAGPEHALHFDPDCEECAYLARPTRETLGSPSTGDDRLRERLAAVVQKWSGHLSERMLDDLERAARATVPAGPGHCRCEDHLQAALTEGCRCADHVHDGLEAARPVPAAEPRDPWIVVTDDCEACGALVGASHAANCVATEWGRPLHVWTGSPSTGDAR